MAAYDLKFPESVTEYRKLAYIAKQLRYYEKIFKKYQDPADELNAAQFRQYLDNWLSDNLVKK